MQNTIEWHEKCYDNRKQSLDKYEKIILKDLEKITQDKLNLDFYNFQIEEAKKVGRKKFDKDKFRKSKKVSSSSSISLKTGVSAEQ